MGKRMTSWGRLHRRELATAGAGGGGLVLEARTQGTSLAKSSRSHHTPTSYSRLASCAAGPRPRGSDACAGSPYLR
jgi:hypothetical protein